MCAKHYKHRFLLVKTKRKLPQISGQIKKKRKKSKKFEKILTHFDAYIGYGNAFQNCAVT
jgi:hypothetical protein